MRACRSGLRARGIWLVALFAAATVGVLSAGSPRAVHASDPPGDCWGGALSAEPLHCYVLEEAQRAGVIEVAAVFVTPSNGLLVFVSHPAPSREFPYLWDPDVVAFFEAKTAEFMDSWPERVFFDHPYHQDCAGYPPYAEASAEGKERYKDCVIQSTRRDNGGLPYTETYVRMDVMIGGADGVRKRGGWAAFTQLWPPPKTKSGEASGQFDVSDVDTVNFPETECHTEGHLPTTCDMSRRHPELDIVGWISKPDANHVQIKAARDDAERIRTVREALVAFYPKVTDERLVTIPVKYSYEELWRWSQVLQRFALSAGNTAGVTSATISSNFLQHEDDILVAGIQEREDENFLTYRTTIVVTSKTPRETADALPQVLGQLGIPVDAVGVVAASYEFVYGPGSTIPEESRGNAAKDGAAAAVSAVDDSPWTLIAVAGSTAAAVAACLAAMAFAVRRVRRHRA